MAASRTPRDCGRTARLEGLPRLREHAAGHAVCAHAQRISSRTLRSQLRASRRSPHRSPPFSALATRAGLSICSSFLKYLSTAARELPLKSANALMAATTWSTVLLAMLRAPALRAARSERARGSEGVRAAGVKRFSRYGCTLRALHCCAATDKRGATAEPARCGLTSAASWSAHSARWRGARRSTLRLRFVAPAATLAARARWRGGGGRARGAPRCSRTSGSRGRETERWPLRWIILRHPLMRGACSGCPRRGGGCGAGGSAARGSRRRRA